MWKSERQVQSLIAYRAVIPVVGTTAAAAAQRTALVTAVKTAVPIAAAVIAGEGAARMIERQGDEVMQNPEVDARPEPEPPPDVLVPLENFKMEIRTLKYDTNFTRKDLEDMIRNWGEKFKDLKRDHPEVAKAINHYDSWAKVQFMICLCRAMLQQDPNEMREILGMNEEPYRGMLERVARMGAQTAIQMMECKIGLWWIYNFVRNNNPWIRENIIHVHREYIDGRFGRLFGYVRDALRRDVPADERQAPRLRDRSDRVHF